MPKLLPGGVAQFWACLKKIFLLIKICMIKPTWLLWVIRTKNKDILNTGAETICHYGPRSLTLRPAKEEKGENVRPKTKKTKVCWEVTWKSDGIREVACVCMRRRVNGGSLHMVSWLVDTMKTSFQTAQIQVVFLLRKFVNFKGKSILFSIVTWTDSNDD